MSKPLLTIGMIFRDDIRCIEKCLKALQPLRDAVPCELIMADTGSVDGSRAVAEQYADQVFDFPWIDDFSAARNAVMDRARGEWYLSVDTDEYLEPDVSQIVDFLNSPKNRKYLVAMVVIRNYRNYELSGTYSDFFAVRMLRMSTGLRYEGAIHEKWVFPPDSSRFSSVLNRLVFKHDGYVGMNEEAGKAKRDRNLRLLRQELEEEPDDLIRLLQYIESGQEEEDFLDRLRYAVDRVKEKPDKWDMMGPPIVRYGVATAASRKLPELEEWTELAREMFPNSYFTRIDVEYYACIGALGAKQYALCISLGGALLQAYEDYRAGRGEILGQMYSSLINAAPEFERNISTVIAVAYLEDGKARKALEAVKALDFSELTLDQTGNVINFLFDLHLRSDVDTSGFTRGFWEGIGHSEPDRKLADERRAAFLVRGAAAFAPDYRNKEEQREGFCRHAYTLFQALDEEDCTLSLAASIMEAGDPQELNALLSRVRRWNELPISALSHALRQGAAFPPAGNPVAVEDMEDAALRLSKDGTGIIVTALEAAGLRSGSWQTLAWARTLALLAVQTCDWKEGERRLSLARRFAEVEDAFLRACYVPELLREENLLVLPSMHRFGWYCARAFEALDAGDHAGCVRLLRMGLSTCPERKRMVEFLVEHIPELRTPLPAPDPELAELAGKVRELLAAYPADDPAVEALKASPVYRRVAGLIEGESK